MQVWKNGSVTEALDVEWLRTYLQDEAGILYQSWRPEDAVWSIYTFFCWHMRSDFRDAHRDLCLLAGISEIESNLFEIVHPPAVVSNCFHAGIQTRRSNLGRVVPCSQTEAAAAIYGCRPEDVARALCRCHQCGCK